MVPNPSPSLTRAATLVVLGYLGLVLATVAYGVVRISAEANGINLVVWGVIPVLIALGLASALRADPSLRLGIALLLVTLSGAVIAVEVTLFFVEDPQPERAAASRHGQSFDGRSRLQVIQALGAQGITALPDLHGRVIVNGGSGSVPLRIEADGRPLLPLAAAASLSEIVLCNEAGDWVRYRSDERGYRNPPGLWALDGLDVLTVGDSFTMGLCMEDSDVPAERIREHWPATLNLGLPGAGPLLELAALREFGPELSPKVVVWMYYEGNDLSDLPPEIGHPILAEYLEPGFRQGLDRFQPEIDRGITEFMTKLASLEAQGAAGPLGARSPLLSIAKLDRIRTLIGLSASLGPPDEAAASLRNVLVGAQQTVHSWGGRLLFVYLPDYNRFALRGVGENHLGRRDVLDLVQDLGIPLVDLLPVFARHDEPKSLWAFPGSHYTREGFELLNPLLFDALANELGRR